MKLEIRNNYKSVFTKFVSICDKNNLWYSLANNTLLSAKTNNDYFVNSNILEIFVTKDTLNFLKLNYKNNLLDFSFTDNFFLSTPFFYIPNNNKFIKIIIIVPTSVEKIKKNCSSIKNKIKYNYSNFLTFKKGHNFKTKFYFFFIRLFSFFCYPIEHNELFDSLFTKNYKGFFAINSLNESNIKNWFPNITFQMEEVDFLGINAKIIKEYDYFLKARYGESWRNGVEIKKSYFDYEKLI